MPHDANTKSTLSAFTIRRTALREMLQVIGSGYALSPRGARIAIGM
jgi:hypothetical protein